MPKINNKIEKNLKIFDIIFGLDIKILKYEIIKLKNIVVKNQPNTNKNK